MAEAGRTIDKSIGIITTVAVLKIDDLFKHKIEKVPKFLFDERVANVFDNMIVRSIPVYEEVHNMLGGIIRHYFPGQGIIYDLGCSTGTTIVYLATELQQNNKRAKIIGVDNSGSMLKKCREKISIESFIQPTLLQQELDTISLQNCDLVIVNYTLQFLKISSRLKLLREIHSKLNKRGTIFLSEKIKAHDEHIQRIMNNVHRDFKRENGYSELEISQKKESLEEVLIPLTPKEQIDMMMEAGFRSSELIFRKYNFASYIGFK